MGSPDPVLWFIAGWIGGIFCSIVVSVLV